MKTKSLLLAVYSLLLLAACGTPKGESGVFNIMDYGAVGDGQTDDAAAIQSAINACNKAGGGQVLVPAGHTFLCSPFKLASYIDLHLEANARLLANPDEKVYKESAFRDNRGEGMMWISGKDLEQVSITGMGTIDGNGVAFIAGDRMSASALPWSAMEMTLAPHPYQLPKPSATHLHLDVAVTGLGGNSCGQGGPLEPDRVKAGNHSMSLIIRPVRKGAFTETAAVSPSGEVPLSILRDRTGMVSVNTRKANAEIVYVLNEDGKDRPYKEPFNLREGGTVTAYYKRNPEVSVTVEFDKMESIPLTVTYASSEETGEGDASHLTDGDLTTMWHTMYSVTVAQYPHWVDFDAGETKSFKGIVYTPRQDGGTNGDIKDFTLQVSDDGKNWGEPVLKGSFRKGKAPQRVMLDKPVKGRYLRFTGLSSQNGADFAGGAEFSVIAD